MKEYQWMTPQPMSPSYKHNQHYKPPYIGIYIHTYVACSKTQTQGPQSPGWTHHTTLLCFTGSSVDMGESTVLEKSWYNMMHVSTLTHTYSRNLLRQTIKDPQNHFLLSDVLLIRICLLHVHYYSKPNNAQNVVRVEQEFVLTRFYCTWSTHSTYTH